VVGGLREVQRRLGHGIEHALGQIHRGVNFLERARCHLELAGADGDQQILDGVRHRAHRCAADHVGGAFEGVDGAEERGHAGIASAGVGEREERCGHRLQMLRGLGDEVADDLVAPREEAHELVSERIARRSRRRGGVGLDDERRRRERLRRRRRRRGRGFGLGAALD
jgi:hypothetical protein